MSADYAENNIGGPVRNLIASPEFRRVFPGINVSPDTAAKGTFRVYDETGSVRQRKGMFTAMGRGGAPTGRGAALLLMDDLLSEADAYSHTERAKLFDEIFRFRSRLAPKAAWIVINTRYHEDDVVGIIQRRYANDRKWETISLPAYAEQDEVWRIERPATPYHPAEKRVFTRKTGEILWPHRQADVEAIRSVLEKESPQMWSGQFMCRPVPASGAMVDIAWFRRYDYAEVAAIRKRAARVVVSVDTGGTRLRQLSGSAARTAASVWAEMEDGKVYLLDVRAEAWAYFDMVQAVKDICADWKPTELLIENKAAGLELIADLREDARWVRTPITSIDPIGSKETRMSVASPPIRAGHVYVPATGTCADVRDPSRPPLWVVDYLNEMQHFPMSSRRDQVDTTSQFLNWRREHPMYLVGVSITPNSDAKKAFLGQLGGPWGRGGGGMARGR
jgi:predicted phage terminase large subunit-like protein